MRARTAEIELADGGTIARPASQWAQAEQLVQAEIAVKNVPTRETVLPLHVQRREHLTVHDGRANVRRIGRQRVDAVIGEAFLEIIPRALAQSIGRILHEDGHDMPPGWGEGI